MYTFSIYSNACLLKLDAMKKWKKADRFKKMVVCTTIGCKYLQWTLNQIKVDCSLEAVQQAETHMLWGCNSMQVEDRLEKMIMLGKAEGSKREWMIRMNRIKNTTIFITE